MNDNEKYKWLFLYISLTDKQREELHNSLPTENCNIADDTGPNVEKTQPNSNFYSREYIHVRGDRSLERTSSELTSKCSTKLKNSSDNSKNKLKKRSGKIEVTSEEEVDLSDCKKRDSPETKRKPIANDEDTHSHTPNSSFSSSTQTQVNSPRKSNDHGNYYDETIALNKSISWTYVNYMVNTSNYNKYINQSNMVNVLRSLKSRFEVKYINPIWNKSGVSMKLRIRIIIPKSHNGRSEEEAESLLESDPESHGKCPESEEGDRYEYLKKELEVLKDSEKRAWVSTLLKKKYLEVTFLIRDGGINTAYKAAIELRNYFYSFMNIKLSKENVIIISDKRVNTSSFKYDKPRYFESKDEIYLTNSIRLLKLVNILEHNFKKDSITARNKNRMIMINSHADSRSDDVNKQVIKKVSVKLVQSSPKSTSGTHTPSPPKVTENKIVISDKVPKKKGWDMERLKRCIIDPPPLPEYYTFSPRRVLTKKTGGTDSGLTDNKHGTSTIDNVGMDIDSFNYDETLNNGLKRRFIDKNRTMETVSKSDPYESGNRGDIANSRNVGCAGTIDIKNVNASTNNTREGDANIDNHDIGTGAHNNSTKITNKTRGHVNNNINKNVDDLKSVNNSNDTRKINADKNDTYNTSTNYNGMKINTSNNINNTSNTDSNKAFNTSAQSTNNKDDNANINNNEVYDYKDFSELENNEKFDVIIIGAGVGGLGAASYLSKKNLKVAVIEARNRIGGRMLTTYFPKITVEHEHEDVDYSYYSGRYDGKYEVRKYTSKSHQGCINLPEISIDLGPNYLHCNNLFFASEEEGKTHLDRSNSGSSGGSSRNGVGHNGNQGSVKANGKAKSAKSEAYEKNMLFNPYKDVRNKRGMEKSILGLASMLRPSVGDISGFSNWEPTLYTNWYNEKAGRKIHFSSVVKVNTVVDHLLMRTSKVFSKLTHAFFTDYTYADDGIGVDNNTRDSLSGGKCEAMKSPDVNDMATTTTMDEESCAYNNYSLSSSCVSDGSNDMCSHDVGDNRVGSAEVQDSVTFEDQRDDIKKQHHMVVDSNERLQHESAADIYDSTHVATAGRVSELAASKGCEHHTTADEKEDVKEESGLTPVKIKNDALQKSFGTRRSTRVKKLSSFLVYYGNLEDNQPGVSNKRKVEQKELEHEEKSNLRASRIIWERINIKGVDELLKGPKNKLLSLWDIYIAIYVELLEEVRKQLKCGLNEVEERLLFAILQSRLGYNSDLRETCISMCKLPMSFHSLYSTFQNLKRPGSGSEDAVSPPIGSSNKDGGAAGVDTGGGVSSDGAADRDASNTENGSNSNNTDEEHSGTISPETSNKSSLKSEEGNDLEIKPFVMSGRVLNNYTRYIRKYFDKYTRLNVTQFDGKSDSDKLVIDGWGWLLNHLIENIKTSIYLNTKLLSITILDGIDVNASCNNDTGTTGNDNTGMSEGDNIGGTDENNNDDVYNIKLTVKRSKNSTTTFNKVDSDAHITNFSDYDLYNYGEDYTIRGNLDNNAEHGTDTKGCGMYKESKKESNKRALKEEKRGEGKCEEDVEAKEDSANTANQEAEEQKVIFSKYVLVTVPNSLVSEIEFEPKLDQNKVKSLQNYDMGYHNKIIMRFKPCEVFWPKHELQFNCLDSSFQFMNLDAYGKKGCLLAHSFPPFSKCFVKITKQVLLMKCLELLHKMFNLEKKVYPVQAFITNWKSDPFSRGSYSYPTKHARDEDVIHLKSPHPLNNPRVLFSGEYVSNSYYQCIDGSYDTSIRAAEDIYNIGLFNSLRSGGKTGDGSGKKSGSVDAREAERIRREKYLDGILNNDHNDNFMGIPVPLPPKELIGYYLTDGSDELFSDDNDFITLPSIFIKSLHDSKDAGVLKREKRDLKANEESSLFNHNEDAGLDRNNSKKRRVLDENYTCINSSGTTPSTNATSAYATKSSANSNIDEPESLGGTATRTCDQASAEEAKELELLLIIKSIFNEDEVQVESLLESYKKFEEILRHLSERNYVNKYTYYSNIIIVSLLTTVHHRLKWPNGANREEERYGNEKYDGGLDKLNRNIFRELSNHKKERVNIRNQRFSRQMIQNTSKLLGLRHDFLCYHCLRGGEVILCDTEGCDLVWHYECLPSAFKPKSSFNLTDVKFEGFNTLLKHESTWKCPICSNFPIKRGERSCSRDVQLYWIRRGYWWRVKATISVSLQIYKRIQRLSTQ